MSTPPNLNWISMDLNSTLLDARGRETWTVGGATAWLQDTYRGYCVSLEWFQGRRSVEPMLAIWPLAAERESGVWCICLSSVGKFCHMDANDRATGTPTQEAMREAAEVLVHVFERPALTVDVFALLDVLMKYIPKLITDVPPAPREVLIGSGREAILEVERLENGKSIEHVTL